ncbi:MAG: hypothetical protein ACLUOF_04480 [Ruminococcus sp.]
MGSCFDCVEPDAHFGQETWEQAEICSAARCSWRWKVRTPGQTLLHLRWRSHEPVHRLHLWNALRWRFPAGHLRGCSTMADGLTASFLAAGGVGEYTAAVTSSHFPRQSASFGFRLLRRSVVPTAQWTCTDRAL